MSGKRKDSRGRVLRNGEIQESNGRYRYKYVDTFGDSKYVRSWRHDKNDPMPAGKPFEQSLRELERQVSADLIDQIVLEGGKLTVLDLVDKYVSLKKVCVPVQKQGIRLL